MNMPLMPNQWIPIAERGRSATALEELTWTEHPGSVMTIAQAHKLAEAGKVLLASMHEPEKILLVVRPATRNQRRVAVGVDASGM